MSGSFVMTYRGAIAIQPEQQRQHRTARQNQLHREIRAERAELLDDPFAPMRNSSLLFHSS
jgi:hypothetical protein